MVKKGVWGILRDVIRVLSGWDPTLTEVTFSLLFTLVYPPFSMCVPWVTNWEGDSVP